MRRVVLLGLILICSTVQVTADEQTNLASSVKVEATKTFSTPSGRDTSYTDPTTGIEFVFVKGRCFQMGDVFGDGLSHEKPVHEVCVDDFYIGKFEVTQGQWKKVSANNPSTFQKGDNYPVEQVSWDDAQNFIHQLNGKSGRVYRLPTEAEWEYAARSGGKKEKYAGGEGPDSVAWYKDNSEGSTHPVGQKVPNGLGLYDLSGNVMEWIGDWYEEEYYDESPKQNPQGANDGTKRVCRGGCWNNSSECVRTTDRSGLPTDWRTQLFGFRLAFPATTN